jgi:hypothetical protein
MLVIHPTQAAPNLPAISAGQGAAHPLWEILDRKSAIDPLDTKGASVRACFPRSRSFMAVASPVLRLCSVRPFVRCALASLTIWLHPSNGLLPRLSLLGRISTHVIMTSCVSILCAGAKPAAVSGEIKYEDVDFHYPTRPDRLVLKQVGESFIRFGLVRCCCD